MTAANVGMVLDMVRTGLLVFEQSLYNDINPPTPDTVRTGKMLKMEVLGWGTLKNCQYIYKKKLTLKSVGEFIYHLYLEYKISWSNI